MDQRHSAGNPGQNNSSLPQRRVFVYDRPFADIRHPQPQRANINPNPPARIRSEPAEQQAVVPTRPPGNSMDGFVSGRQPTHIQPMSPATTFTQKPVPVQQVITTPLDKHPNREQNTKHFDVPPPQQQQPPHQPPVQQSFPQPPQESLSDNQWSMELPEDLQESQSPINARVQQPQQNGNWHPVQAPQLQSTPVASWQQPAIEQQFQQNAKRRRKSLLDYLRSFIPHAIKIIAVIILISGVAAAVTMIRANQATSNISGNFNQAESDELGIFNTQPIEDPGANTGTLGASRSLDAPKAVKIDAIDLAARVVAVGTSRNSFIKAPANIYDLGWYEGSAKPGTKGVVLLHGHIAGPTRPGALYEVALLKRGDVISVERGDGKIYNYTVQTVEFFENDQIDMSKMLTPYNPNRNGLNIMTAGGRYNTETGAYELRAAIYAIEDTN